MRVLFLNHNYRYQGTYYRAMPMAEQLAKRGHRVTLMTVSRDHRWRTGRSDVNGVRVIETPGLGQDNSGGGYGPLDNGLRCIQALSQRYDIIHAFDHKPSATFAGFVGRLRGARLVADWADWWGGPGGVNDVPQRRIPAVGRFEVWWEEKSKLWADGVVTISTVLQKRAIELGCAPERTLYLPTGSAVDRIRPMPVLEARQKLGFPAERRVVGFIGNAPQEIAVVLRALVQLPDVWLMLIGRKNIAVLNLARSLGVEDRIWQTGFIPDDEVSLYLACADVMVLPMTDSAANRGRLPNKILDYMAAGRPTVASPVGDVKEILEKHRAGLTANNDQFADAIRRLLADRPLRDELGHAARRVAETVFGWSHLVDRLEKFYEHLLREAKGV